MDAARWQVIERLYHAAQQLPAEKRAAFLKEVCTGDEAMRLEVEALLDTPVTAARFLENPAVAMGGIDMGETFVLTGRRLGVYTSPMGKRTSASWPSEASGFHTQARKSGWAASSRLGSGSSRIHALDKGREASSIVTCDMQPMGSGWSMAVASSRRFRMPPRASGSGHEAEQATYSSEQRERRHAHLRHHAGRQTDRLRPPARELRHRPHRSASVMNVSGDLKVSWRHVEAWKWQHPSKARRSMPMASRSGHLEWRNWQGISHSP